MVRSIGGVTLPMLWSALLRRWNRTILCLAAVTQGRSKNCLQAAGLVIMPTHSSEDFAYGKKPLAEKIPTMRDDARGKMQKSVLARERKRKHHRYDSDIQTVDS